MAIALPQVLVFQQFQAVPSELTDPLRAFIFGAEYDLHRYGVDGEEAQEGSYSATALSTINYVTDLGARASSVIDEAYTKVYLKDALLKMPLTISSARTPDEGVYNKIFTAKTLVSSTGFTREAELERDVQVGDYVKYTDGGSNSGEGTILGFEANIGSTSKDSDCTGFVSNKLDVAALAPVSTQVGATDFNLVIADSYEDGIQDGHPSETYTVTVVRGTADDTPGDAILNITSASGTDDVLGYVPTGANWAASIDHPLGSRGLTFDLTNASGALTQGFSWTIPVAQAFTAPDPATFLTGGTYTGTQDTRYIITVSRGGDTSGLAAAQPQITVTTSNGYDSAAAINVADVSGGADVNIGNFGITMEFSGPGVILCKGDQYYFDAAAAPEEEIQTVLLNQSLPAALVTLEEDGSGANIITFSVEIFIKDDIEIHKTTDSTEIEDDASGDTNWVHDGLGNVVLQIGMREFHPSWGDPDNGATGLSIDEGDIYIHWREAVTEHSDQIYSFQTLAELTDEFTTANDPDNPVVYGAAKALANAGTENAPVTGVRVMALPGIETTLSNWQTVLNLAEGREDVYAFAPMTFDPAVQAIVATHVTTMSTPEIGQWRIAFVCTEEPVPLKILDENDNGGAGHLLGTLVGTTVTLSTDGGGTARFIDGQGNNVVEVGDTVRVNYEFNAYGVEQYEEFEVSAVTSDLLLEVTSARADGDLDTNAQIEIWRTMDNGQTIDYIGDLAGSFSSRRVYNVYPSTINSGGVAVDGYYLCAAIAGLVGASVPQQGLTNVELRGFDDAGGVLNRYSRSELDTFANKAVWIVTEDPADGTIYTRHQLSTDITDINTRELSVVKNVDSISYVYRNGLKRFIGRANVSPATLRTLRTQIESRTAFLKSAGFSALLGGQVLDGTEIAQLRAHEVLKDRVVIVINLVIPYPLNNIELTLVI